MSDIERKTCDTEIDGKKYTAACAHGVTEIFDEEGEGVVSFRDPHALASREGPLVMFVKLYLRGVRDGEEQGRAALAREARALFGAAAAAEGSRG